MSKTHGRRAATLAHISDLHIGRSADDEARAGAFVRAALAGGIDRVLVTGDITHRGRTWELARFRDIFEPLAEAGRLSMVPGNHDRLGDDVRDAIMWGPRVQADLLGGLYLVRFDSTGPHNRHWLHSHGALGQGDIEEIVAALEAAPRDRLVALALHHHPLPLPNDSAVELVPSLLGRRWTAELDLGYSLVRAILGRCDLVLHGHRHMAREIVLQGDMARPLHIYNAGSSTELGKMRVFSHARGALLGPPEWQVVLAAAAPKVRARRAPAPGLDGVAL